jgi:hypothetical protein
MLWEHMEHHHADMLLSTWESGGAEPEQPLDEIEKAAQLVLDTRGLGWKVHVRRGVVGGTLMVWMTRKPPPE